MAGPARTVLDEIRGEDTRGAPNGELVFDAPWESRAFGIAVALADGGVVSYDEFRHRLIARVAAWEAEPPPGEEARLRCWLEALEQVVEANALVAEADVVERAAQLTSRPAGHDHGHEHSHSHLEGASDR